MQRPNQSWQVKGLNPAARTRYLGGGTNLVVQWPNQSRQMRGVNPAARTHYLVGSDKPHSAAAADQSCQVMDPLPREKVKLRIAVTKQEPR